jgi:hypothetical protein
MPTQVVVPSVSRAYVAHGLAGTVFVERPSLPTVFSPVSVREIRGSPPGKTMPEGVSAAEPSGGGGGDPPNAGGGGDPPIAGEVGCAPAPPGPGVWANAVDESSANAIVRKAANLVIAFSRTFPGSSSDRHYIIRNVAFGTGFTAHHFGKKRGGCRSAAHLWIGEFA